MGERFFILDKYNTWYDWRLVLTEKEISPPEPKTNYVNIDGMSGSLDLSEALTGEITYEDREIAVKFWTDYGTRRDREKLIRNITAALHGKKIKIIEPDDESHYFYGRVTIKSVQNVIAYAEIDIEIKCEPWRYALNESERRVDVDGVNMVNTVIRNEGVKTLCPLIAITGNVELTYEGAKTTLSDGTYKISDIKLRAGANVIGVSGNGSATFTYREADL